MSPRHRRSHAVLPGLPLTLLPLSFALVTPAAGQSLIAPVWSGVYAGVHGSANWHDIRSGSGARAEENSASFGAHLGLNLGLGLVVAGVEADIGIDSASASNGLTAPGIVTAAEINASGTARGRIGLPVGPLLFYATAGYAWTDLDIRVSMPGGPVWRSASFNGIVYGGGVEAQVLPRLSVRLEALHHDYSERVLDLGALGRSIDTIDPSTTVVRAGLSFRFN